MRMSGIILFLLLIGLYFLIYKTSKKVGVDVKQQPTVALSVLCSNQTATVPLSHRRLNRLPSEYDTCLEYWLKVITREKLAADNPHVIRVASSLVEPASNHVTKRSHGIRPTPQSMFILNLLKNKTGGFFVEAGAFDGFEGSNSLWLEQSLGWTGILVEMDPYFYTILKGHSRHSWSINCCLSIYNYSTIMNVQEATGSLGRVLDSHALKMRRYKSSELLHIPCFPLYSLLLAINQTVIDYLSLDVEGSELQVLQTIPFDKLDIKTLSVEFVHGAMGQNAYVEFMKSKGYDMVRKMVIRNPIIHVCDFIFVKRGMTNLIQ